MYQQKSQSSPNLEEYQSVAAKEPDMAASFGAEQIKNGAIQQGFGANNLPQPPVDDTRLLDPDVRDYAMVDVDDSTDQDVLDKNPEILEEMDWIDIVRMWYYELGDSSLGSDSNNPITFSQDAKTTKDLMNHPSSKTVVDFAKARVAAGNMEAFTVQVKYDVSGFWKSIAANDVPFNYLGSFVITAEPDATSGTIKYTANNKSSRESGSRFRRDPNAEYLDNKIGIFENVPRERDGAVDMNEVRLGGDLNIAWVWKTSF